MKQRVTAITEAISLRTKGTLLQANDLKLKKKLQTLKNMSINN